MTTALVNAAVRLAAELQREAAALQTAAERRQQAELARMLGHPDDKATLVELTDRAFRSHAAARTAEQFTHILDVQGIPRFFSPLDRALLRGFQTFGDWLPSVTVPLVQSHLRHETANVVLPAEPELLRGHLAARRRQGLRMNLNFLGEALLGEREARARLDRYVAALAEPDVEVLSVKISTIDSQIVPIAREHALGRLSERLEMLYRATLADDGLPDPSPGREPGDSGPVGEPGRHGERDVQPRGVPRLAPGAFLSHPRPAPDPSPGREPGDSGPSGASGRIPQGSDAVKKADRRLRAGVGKLLYLDMEEYRDLALTAEAFMRTLDRPGLERARAGIALQAYVPDSFAWQRRITEWARRRVARGGEPVTIRIVKGANMEMERVDAAVHGWPQAPFRTKAETDATYKRMLAYALEPEHLAAVHVGVATHNLFDVAYGLLLAERAGADDRVQFEMLEGMANQQRRALSARGQPLLLYAPACRKEDFVAAIGYLIRRLDENTGPENFLGHAFRLEVGGPDWHMLEAGFRRGFSTPVSDRPRRTQDRRTETFPDAVPERPWQDLVNEPDTDWSLPANAAWAESVVGRDPDEFAGLVVPAVVAGREVAGPETQPCQDPSRPGITLCRHALATEADVEEAVACAAADPDGWRRLGHDARSAILGRVAGELRRARAELLRVALLDGGKLLPEADPEVSEAIDFVEFYRAAARGFLSISGARATPAGAVVVVSPWNFPLAIPCGGIAAALAAGNTVILKPASDAVLAAWEICRCFWRAGVSRTALQFLPCRGSGPGARLVAHPDVAAVILTGGTDTALRMLAATPSLRLSAETGGKNATIVTAMSDRELAIRHVVQSAFGHGGQKCSATSLLLLEAEVHDDPGFRRMLCDAVESLHVDSAHVLHARVGPLIRPPSGDLARGLTTLEPGESWAVAPRPSPTNPALWSPGVKWGVRPGSFTHRTELFGPVLGVMRYERLAEAIEIVNATGYGLTSAIHSLDDREVAEWRRGIRAGNLYVNRGTTGAIVLRQPFGGLGRSCFGPGLKAGGPNYVAAFMDFADAPPAGPPGTIADGDLAALADRLPDGADGVRLRAALAEYDLAWREEFSREHDHVRLLGQDNVRRYLPFAEVRVRLVPADSWFDVVARVAAARVTGARVVASFAPGCPADWRETLDAATDPWAAGIEFVDESDAALAATLAGPHDLRIRYAGRDRVPPEVRRAAAATGRWVADLPVVSAGRVELLWYLREQTISTDYHRYGNLGRRAAEARRPVE